jgi:hypothetical protein
MLTNSEFGLILSTVFYSTLFHLKTSEDARIEPRTVSVVELFRSRLDLIVSLLKVLCVLVREDMKTRNWKVQ